MTEKSRLDTAAAAIVRRMMILRRPLVLLLELPWEKASKLSIIPSNKRQRNSGGELRRFEGGK